MEQDKFGNVDDFLSRRAAPPEVRPDLAENIIHAALSMPKQDTKTWNFKNIFPLLSLPRMAMAASVIVCLVIAVEWNSNTSIQTPNLASLQQPADPTGLEDEEWAMVLDVYDEGFSL